MSRPSVQFFYDIVSPYSVLAFRVLMRYEKAWNLNLRLRPFFIGGIMRGSGNKPPGAVGAKGAHFFIDVQRCAKYYDVKFKFPEDIAELMFNNGTLSAQRFISAVDLTQPEKVKDVTSSLLDRIWIENKDVTPEGIAEAAKAAGLSSDTITDLLGRIKSDEVKEHLKKTTQEALDYGAFGSPTFIIETAEGPQLVFGSDRWPIIADMIGKKWDGPYPGESSKL